MKNKRNVGIVGHPDSGANEVFAAILRIGITPPAPEGAAICDGTEYIIYEEETPPPYNPKNRKKLFKGD